MSSQELNDQTPTIELYMYSLNQEFPVGKGHHTYLKRHAELKPDLRGELTLNASVESQVFQLPLESLPADWSVQWLENQWIENHTKAAGMGIREDFDPLLTAIARVEDFGGIVFEPQSDRVYKLNPAGMKLFSALQEEAKAGRPMSKAGVGGVEPKLVEVFLGQMRAAGLLGLS